MEQAVAKTTAPFRPPAPDEPSKPCSECGRLVGTSLGPEAQEIWCTDVCHDAWMAADPARREGWVSLSDLTIEQQADLFRRSGLNLAIDGIPVGPRQPS